MVLGHADGDGGRHQPLDLFAHSLGQRLRTDGIGADQAIGAMLFGGSDGNDDALASRQIALRIGPSLQRKKHCTISSMASFACLKPAWQGRRENAMIRLESFRAAAAPDRAGLSTGKLPAFARWPATARGSWR